MLELGDLKAFFFKHYFLSVCIKEIICPIDLQIIPLESLAVLAMLLNVQSCIWPQLKSYERIFEIITTYT